MSLVVSERVQMVILNGFLVLGVNSGSLPCYAFACEDNMAATQWDCSEEP